MKRLFDIFFSLSFIILLLVPCLLISLIIVADSGFPFFYRQKRVGKNGVEFLLLKFRTMKQGADQKGLLTVGAKDARITASGYLLRKFKLDELPQLFNVLKGEMSMVGPRPEVRKYVEMYSPEQTKVLSVTPGITDLASIAYSNENEILSRSDNPEQYYIQVVMPAKLKLNLEYVEKNSFGTDLMIIMKTVGKILS
jgi:lipopolysaccharide/colanic/teichoic acid biosynthesis glycosyltransferase